MAATGLLALLDDITAIMDDVAVLSKVAAQKTAGIAGDDLAVNAQGLVGIDPSRELPIVGKVALGSVANKFVLVPLALLLPQAVITPLLMLGGAFLCYEGVHKVMHRKDAADDAHHAELVAALKSGPEAVQKVEAQKVKQAIITDVILSAEIVAVALGTVADEPMAQKAIVLSVVALGMTAAIYGLVAVIVKLDDVGLHLQERGGAAAQVGRGIVAGMPYMMKTISVLGTIAMFLVGGGIILHGIPGLEYEIHHIVEAFTHNGALQGLLNTGLSLGVGVAVGLVVSGIVAGVKKMAGVKAAH